MQITFGSNNDVFVTKIDHIAKIDNIFISKDKPTSMLRLILGVAMWAASTARSYEIYITATKATRLIQQFGNENKN